MAPKQWKNVRALCSTCVRALKWIPVIFISAIVAWSYYAYVIHICFFTVESIIQTVCYLLVFHAIFVMFVWSYWQTIFTPVPSIPVQFKLHQNEAEMLEKDPCEENARRFMENLARDLPVLCRTMHGGIRYCEKCHSIKPDRAHHCSVCETCVLKMDHHCPWINNCVSFANYKFFVLFLGYGLLYCAFVAATSTQYFVEFWTHNISGHGRYHILFLFFVSVMFGISLISLFSYHCYLISVNRSTLESFRSPVYKNGPCKEGFNLGPRGNFLEIFGKNKTKWFLPLFSSSGDGIIFPQKIVDEETFVY